MKRLLYIGNKLSGSGKTPTGIEILGPLLESEGFVVRYASSAPNKLHRLAQMLGSVLRYRSQTDFVLIDTYSTSNFWYAMLVSQMCRLFGLRYIAILHGGNLPVRLKNNPVWSRFLFANAYRNIAPSGYLVQKFREAGYDRVYRIPNPVPIGDIAFKERKIFAPRLLWVRSLSAIYNPEMAVKTLSLLKKDFPDATLCMVGPNSGCLKNVEQVAAGLGLPVRFTGRLDKKDWLSLSAEYDFFINTSNVDNMPFSLVEAAALGLAIVSTNVGGIPFLFQDNATARLVAPSDFEAMAHSIADLIRHPGTAREMTVRARQIALDCDWSQARGQWLEILK